MNQTATSRFKIRTSALRAYTMLAALIVIWLFSNGPPSMNIIVTDFSSERSIFQNYCSRWP